MLPLRFGFSGFAEPALAVVVIATDTTLKSFRRLLRRTRALNLRDLHRSPVHLGQAGLRFNSRKRTVNQVQNRRHVNSKKISGKEPQPFLGLFQMNEHAPIDFLPELMIRSRQLDESLDEKPAILRTIFPNLFPSLVRFPKLSGIKQSNPPLQMSLFVSRQVKRSQSVEIDAG